MDCAKNTSLWLAAALALFALPGLATGVTPVWLLGAARRSVTLSADTRGHFIAMGTINGGSLRIGDIGINNVDAVVSENDAIGVTLLGMSFLNRMEMKRDAQSLTLVRRY